MKMTVTDAINILKEVKELDDSMYKYNSAYMNALDMAITALRWQNSKTQEWIPIRSIKPRTADHVLVTIKWDEDDYEVSELDYDLTKVWANGGDRYCQNLIAHIIAWQYMPVPYEETADGN